MKIVKVLMVITAVAFLGLIAFTQTLALHDQHTRRDILALVAKELPVGASLSDMQAFMQKHAARYALDDRFHHVYGGFLPQSRQDKNLFDREVGVELHFDEQHRFTTAEVTVYYTFL